MADPTRAQQLVMEDSLASRGGYDGTDESDLDGLGHDMYASTPQGKAWDNRARFSEDGEEDDMTWEPPATPAQWQARMDLGEPAYQPHRVRYASQKSNSMAGGMKPPLWWRSAGINVLFILAWYLFSTLISVYNKWMFSPDYYGFPYPLFVTACHMGVQWGLSALTLTVFKGLRSKNRPASKDYVSKVVPCGVATGLDIGLSNLSLQVITLSFYTMCKSSSLAFVLLFAFLFKLETPSWRLAGIILIITSGVVLMVSTETQFNLTGMIEVLTASALGGLRWSLTQILLDKESMGMGNPFATLFWLAPVMGITLGLASITTEGWGNVFGNERFFGSFSQAMVTTGTILFPGLIAFMMNVTEFGLIQRTSVVTLSVAGIFKEVAVIFLSMFIFHDQLTPINISGLAVTVFGIALYNYLKYTQATGSSSSHDRPEFHALEEEYDDRSLVSPRARNAARLLGTTNDSALALDHFPSYPSAPLHSLGVSDSPASSRSASLELPSQTTYPFLGDGATSQHHLHRASSSSKARQHDAGRVSHLEDRVEESMELGQLEAREKRMEKSLDEGIEGHREAEDWELLLNGDDDDGHAGGAGAK